MKNIRIGVWFSCNFSGFLAIGTFIVTYGAGEKSCCQWCRFSYLWCYCLWCSLVTKSESSCQWCTLAFGAVILGHPLFRFQCVGCGAELSRIKATRPLEKKMRCFLHTGQGFLQFSPVLTNFILHTLIRPEPLVL